MSSIHDSTVKKTVLLETKLKATGLKLELPELQVEVGGSEGHM